MFILLSSNRSLIERKQIQTIRRTRTADVNRLIGGLLYKNRKTPLNLAQNGVALCRVT